MILSALEEHNVVLIDYLPIKGIVEHNYPLDGIHHPMIDRIVSYAIQHGKKIIWTTDLYPPSELISWGHQVMLPEFQKADYQFLLNKFLGSQACSLDIDAIFRSAPQLNGHELRKSCEVLTCQGTISTDAFIEYVCRDCLKTNVSLQEVEKVERPDIFGLEDVLEQLEKKVIFPLISNELSDRFSFQPVKGVLLYGPPGTGKSSLGRYLAHRLNAKFLLLDGRSYAHHSNPFENLRRLFAQARHNAPSVLFMDDLDAVWNEGGENPFYQYLLSEIDGLENLHKGIVCVIMTVMDIEKLPAALIRSGRLELWLETKLPDDSVRLEILQGHISRLPEPLCQARARAIVPLTAGLNCADLRSLVEQAKICYGYDYLNHASVMQPDEYFQISAIERADHRKRKGISGFSKD